jgi:hypothetical protein
MTEVRQEVRTESEPPPRGGSLGLPAGIVAADAAAYNYASARADLRRWQEWKAEGGGRKGEGEAPAKAEGGGGKAEGKSQGGPVPCLP